MANSFFLVRVSGEASDVSSREFQHNKTRSRKGTPLERSPVRMHTSVASKQTEFTKSNKQALYPLVTIAARLPVKIFLATSGRSPSGESLPPWRLKPSPAPSFFSEMVIGGPRNSSSCASSARGQTGSYPTVRQGQMKARWSSGGGQTELRWRSDGGQMEFRWR